MTVPQAESTLLTLSRTRPTKNLSEAKGKYFFPCYVNSLIEKKKKKLHIRNNFYLCLFCLSFVLGIDYRLKGHNEIRWMTI